MLKKNKRRAARNRPKKSYISDDPVKRARSLANLDKRNKLRLTTTPKDADEKTTQRDIMKALEEANIVEFTTATEMMRIILKPVQEVWRV